MIERRTITDREEWLQWRRQDVTASAVGALFGAHPYESVLKLYAEKCGVERRRNDSGVKRRGRLLEGAVALAASEQYPAWRIEKAAEYFRDPDLRLGCTPDFFVHGDPRGLGVLQAKTVAPRIFQSEWDGQPPFWIALQTLTEMMLTAAEWGAVAALIIDPYRLDCHIYDVPRHDGAEDRIRRAVTDFWDAIASGRTPSPDYAHDADLIAALYPRETPRKVIDLAGDNELPAMLEQRAELKARMADEKRQCEAIDAEIKYKMGDAEIALLPGWHISWKTYHRREYVVPEQDIRTLRITSRNGGS